MTKKLWIKYVLWLADYTGNPDVKCTYQQYTSSGKVPGINGNVDMNYFFGEKPGGRADGKNSTRCVECDAKLDGL